MFHILFSLPFPLIALQGRRAGGKGVCGTSKMSVVHSLKTTGLDELEGLFKL